MVTAQSQLKLQLALTSGWLLNPHLVMGERVLPLAPPVV